jgi:hypothetical protein
MSPTAYACDVPAPSSMVVDPLTPDAAQQMVRRAATAMFDIVETAAPVIARQMIARVPALGPADDQQAFEATRRSALGSMYELLCMTRAGVNEPTLIETSPEALEHLRFLKHRDAGFRTVLGFYQIGFAMFEPLMAAELARFLPDAAAQQRMAGPTREFIFTYVDRITRRLAAEYGTERDGWVPDPADPAWHDPDSVAVTHRLIEELRAAPREAEGVAARRYTARALDSFVDTMESAARDERLSLVLCRAQTTVRIQLADDPDMAVTLLLDREPIEVIDQDVASEVAISIVSVDLARLYSPDFHLPMAILRGRVRYTGPVRKFLRITPVVRHASLPGAAQSATVLT